LTTPKDTADKLINDEVALCDTKKQELQEKQLTHLRCTYQLVANFQSDMSVFTDPSKLKTKEMQRSIETESTRAYYEKLVEKSWASVKKSPLFCSFYFPDKYAQTADPYERFGFDWPKKKDLVEICMTHKIEPKDLILEKMYWIGEGHGFGMLQLCFKGGITSPAFVTHRHENPTNFSTTYVKPGRINHVRLLISENKWFERVDFTTKRNDAEGFVEATDTLATMKQCRCETVEPVYYDIPEGHSIVGVYGLSSTNKYITPDMTERKWSEFRGIGFITMDINA